MQPPAGLPRLPRREVWAELPDPYPGLKFHLWVNAPQRLWNDVQSGDDERGKAALKQIVLEHNGWLDFDGQPYAPASETAFWDEIPTELLAVMITVANLEMTKLPNSLMPQRKRR